MTEASGHLREREALLERRARELARPLVRKEGERRLLLTFHLGKELLGIPAASVEGVARLLHLVPVAGAPAAVAGVAVWRGEVLPVLDTAELVGIRRNRLDDRAWMVVVGGRRSVGLLTHAPADVVPLETGDLSRRGPEDRAPDGVVEGITPDGVTVLDVERLFNDLIDQV